MDIGTRLKQIRKQKSLSPQAFAALVSTSFGYISELEKGKSIPGGAFLLAFKEAFSEINLEWLITGTGDMIVPVVGEPDADYSRDRPPPDVITEKILLILDKMPEKRRLEAEPWDGQKEDRRVCPRGGRRRVQ